ncbi:HPF/RaiA family ribosome-associated protein [Planctomycetota bacterium]
MRLSVSGDHVRVTTALRKYVDRCLYFALGRFGPAIDHVSVRVGDVNGPRGGVDKHCQIVVKLRASGSNPIAVDDTDEDLRAAVTRASNRAGRTVARAIDRKRRKRAYQRRRLPVDDNSRAMHLDGQEEAHKESRGESESTCRP